MEINKTKYIKRYIDRAMKQNKVFFIVVISMLYVFLVLNVSGSLCISRGRIVSLDYRVGGLTKTKILIRKYFPLLILNFD